MTRRTFVLSALLASTLPVSAQEQAVPRRVKRIPLSEALKRIDWKADRFGPLLVIQPQATGPLLATAEPESWTLRAVAPLYDQRVVKYGNLTALVPNKMVLMDGKPGAPEAIASLSRQEARELLLGALTEAQWRLLTGANGLGLEDVTEEQQPLFLQSLPASQEVEDASGKHLLSERAWQSIRLRLNRAVHFALYDKALPVPNSYHLLNSSEILPAERRRSFVVSAVEQARDNGSAERQEVPNRLKPSGLDYSTLTAPVSLVGCKSVGELVARVRQATGHELYVDGRVAALDVALFLPTEEVRIMSGDLLRTLALALGSTVRRLDPEEGGTPVYVFTYDLTGLAVYYARSQERTYWQQKFLSVWQEEARKNLVEKNVGRFLNFASDDPFAVSADIIAQFAKHQEKNRANHTWENFRLPQNTAGLPRRLSEHLSQHFRKNGGEESALEDSIGVMLSYRWNANVPGFGTVLLQDVFGDDTSNLLLPDAKLPVYDSAQPKQPDNFAWPATIKRRALQLTVTTNEDAEKAVAWAHEYGFTSLWLTVLPDASNLPLLQTILASKPALPITAVVPFLRQELVEGKQEVIRDRNLFGETSEQVQKRVLEYAERVTKIASNLKSELLFEAYGDSVGDWMRCELSETRTMIGKRFQQVASLPGLTGIAFSDTYAIGYMPSPSEIYSPFLSMRFGYTPNHRIAFLQKYGYDPIDLFKREGATKWRQWEIPAYSTLSEADSPYDLWPSFLEETWSKAVGKIIDTLPSNCPLFLSRTCDWFPLVKAYPAIKAGETLIPHVKSPQELKAGQDWMSFSLDNRFFPEEMVTSLLFLSEILKIGLQSHDSFVLDLSKMPFARATALLKKTLATR